MRRMLGRAVMVAMVVATAMWTAGGEAFASGGGGCGRRVTDQRGTKVLIRDYCFLSTVTRVRPGDTVTFVNKDQAAHTVIGANATWGSYRELRHGRRDTYRFTRPGVYPYVCTWHPGMMGAVVVGGGVPHTSGAATTASGPVVQVEPLRGARPAVAAVDVPPVPVTSGTAVVVVAWLAGIVLALFAVVAATYGRRERRTIVA
jgi:plastocyanin